MKIMKTWRRRIGLIMLAGLPCVRGRAVKDGSNNMARWNDVGFVSAASIFVLGFMTGCTILSGTSRNIGEVTTLRPTVREIVIVSPNSSGFDFIKWVVADLRKKRYVPVVSYEDFERYCIPGLQSTIKEHQDLLAKAVTEQNMKDLKRWTEKLSISRAALAEAKECIRTRSGKIPAVLSYEGEESTVQDWKNKWPCFPSCLRLKEKSEIRGSPAVLEFVFSYHSKQYKNMFATRTFTIEDLTLTYREAGAVKWRHHFKESFPLFIEWPYSFGQSSLTTALDCLPPWEGKSP